MRTKIAHLWEKLHTSYWFLPALMVGLAVVLALAMVQLDGVLAYERPEGWGWLYAGGAAGARTLLSTLAGSMITVAGVTFSITIVALTLASSQFGPRLLNNFVRDTGNQFVLGTFIATFLYCLLVLRTIRDVEEVAFVPHLSITIAVVLGIASLGVLIYFIHHVSVSIQAETVIAGVGHDLDEAIGRLFPDEKSFPLSEQEMRKEEDLPPDLERESNTIAAGESGYLQAINQEELMKLAVEHDLLLQLKHRPGDFVIQDNDLVLVWPQKHVDEEIIEKIKGAFFVGVQRLRTQDVEFAINQLVEIAVRALSPGINDPFTAMACVDHLGVVLSHLAKKTIPSAYRYDDGGNLRLIFDPITFAGLTDSAFNQIRQYAQTCVAVTIRLLETIAVIGTQATRDEERAALLRHATMIQRGSQALPEACDQEEIERQYHTVKKILAR